MSGKKSEKRDDSYFAASRRKKKRAMMIIIPIIAAVVAIGVAAGVLYSQTSSNFGPLGSAHVHAAFLVKLDGTNIDFSQQKYQVQSKYMHVENGDGTTLHRHATDVPFSEFLKSIGMEINENNCFVLDDGTEYCESEGKQLRHFVNGEERQTINDYVLNDQDRFLVIYGSENNAQIGQALNELQQIQIKG